jgi:hypothetical protein
MKKTLKIALLFYFLFADFMLFAQIGGPGDEDNNGGDGLEGGDPPAAAINTKLWMLLLLALVYSYFKFKKSIQIK